MFEAHIAPFTNKKFSAMMSEQERPIQWFFTFFRIAAQELYIYELTELEALAHRRYPSRRLYLRR